MPAERRRRVTIPLEQGVLEQERAIAICRIARSANPGDSFGLRVSSETHDRTEPPVALNFRRAIQMWVDGVRHLTAARVNSRVFIQPFKTLAA